MLAIVTGASSGFGYSISKKLLENGYKVIGLARRKEKLIQIQEELGNDFFPVVMDISDDYYILEEKLKYLNPNFNIKDVDVLVNNAGLALGIDNADESDINDWHKMINTNILGLVNITRLILPFMVSKNKGYIINIGSIAGSYPYPGGNIYGATKAFVKQFSLNLRADLSGKRIRVSNIEPGLCGDTEFSLVRFKGDGKKVEQLYKDKDPILPNDIANTVYWILSQPEHVNINRIEIMPTSQSFNPLKVSKLINI